MKKRKRILHVIQNLNYGGMERLLADIVRLADRDRVESHILALQYLGRFAEGLDSFATLHVAPQLPRWSMLWPRPLISHISRIVPDVVHTHSGVWYKASLAARKAGVPVIIHTEHGLHLTFRWHDRVITRLAARRTNVVVAVSDALAQRLATVIAPAEGQLIVVHNGVDVERFRPRPDTGAVRRELDLSAEVPIVGSIGRLEHIKGYDLMILAFAELRATDDVKPPPVLVLAGEGSERPRLEVLVKNLGIAGSVHFLGWRDDVHDLHSAFSLFTLSSRSEGTSVSLLEAMSAGICPVVTDVGGNATVVGEKLRHRLVPADNRGALAAAWRHALTVREQREADAAAARARVNESFRLDAMVRTYERLYDELPAR